MGQGSSIGSELSRACFFSSLAGFLYAYTVVCSGVLLTDTSFVTNICSTKLNVDDAAQCEASDVSDQPSEWVNFCTYFTALFSVGAMVGAFFSGQLSDQVGRKVTMMASAMFFIIGTAMTITGRDTAGVLFSRVITGFSMGLMSSTSQVYISEISTPEMRGMMSTVLPIVLTIGLLSGCLADYIGQGLEALTRALDANWAAATVWQYMLGAAIPPAAAVLVGMAVAPESPRWLMAHEGYRAAEQSLRRLRGLGPALEGFRLGKRGLLPGLRSGGGGGGGAAAAAAPPSVKEELLAMANGCHAAGAGAGGGVPQGTGPAAALLHLARSPAYRGRLAAAAALQIGTQLSGIGLIKAYGPTLMAEVGLVAGGSGSTTAMVILYSCALVGTLLASRWVDRAGRRALLLRGGAGLAAANAGAAAAGWAYQATGAPGWGAAMVACMAAYMLCLSASWGPLCWTWPAEVFPMGVRATAVAGSTLCYYAALYVDAYALYMVQVLGLGGSFFVLAVISVAALAYYYQNIPETKGVPLEEMDFLFELDDAAPRRENFLSELCSSTSSQLDSFATAASSDPEASNKNSPAPLASFFSNDDAERVGLLRGE